MNESNLPESEASASKKISLAEAVRNKLAQKKQAQGNNKSNNPSINANQKLKSQITKKPNNQRRRTGGS